MGQLGVQMCHSGVQMRHSEAQGGQLSAQGSQLRGQGGIREKNWIGKLASLSHVGPSEPQVGPFEPGILIGPFISDLMKWWLFFKVESFIIYI